MRVIRILINGIAFSLAVSLAIQYCGSDDDKVEKPDTPPVVQNLSPDGGTSDGGTNGVSCTPPKYCWGLDQKCYGPCTSGSCTTEASGACSQPSSGGVYCCIPTGGIACTESTYPTDFDSCQQFMTCKSCSIEACAVCYSGGGCCTGYRTTGAMQSFFPCGTHEKTEAPDCTQAAQDVVSYCGCGT